MTALVTEHGPTIPAHELEAARTALRDDADALTTVQQRTVTYDDGSARIHTAPSLLAQLENDVHGGTGPAGSFSPRSKPPTGIDALTVLAEIDRHTSRPPHRDRASWVHAWAMAQSSSRPALVLHAAERVADWRGGVTALLDPMPRFQVRGQACPACGAAKVHDRVDHGAGEHHARPALEVDPHTGETRCRCCAATWAAELHEHLRHVLEQQRLEHLQADPTADPTVRARTPAEKGLRWFDLPRPVAQGDQ